MVRVTAATASPKRIRVRLPFVCHGQGVKGRVVVAEGCTVSLQAYRLMGSSTGDKIDESRRPARWTLEQTSVNATVTLYAVAWTARWSTLAIMPRSWLLVHCCSLCRPYHAYDR